MPKLIWKYHSPLEAGCDEAGRGCLAGPVVAAAVILGKRFRLPGLDDSKKLTHHKRMELRDIIESKAEAWAVGWVDQEEIDQINILNASFLAMHRALDQLSVSADIVLVDGNRFTPYKQVPHECIIKGDGKISSIAAASILAKTYRDDFMAEKHNHFPVYNWKKNKGYPTLEHRKAIAEFGDCDLHRKSFKLLLS